MNIINGLMNIINGLIKYLELCQASEKGSNAVDVVELDVPHPTQTLHCVHGDLKDSMFTICCKGL